MIHDLKPYPAMKDSGMPWLGQVPEHWEARPVRRFAKVFAGATPSRAEPKYWDGGTIPWLSSGDVNQRIIKKVSQFITDQGFAASSTKWIRPKSVVLALAGQGKTKGMVATVEIATTCNQSLAVIESQPRVIHHHFLGYYLESRYEDIRGLVGELRDGLNLEHVKSIPVPIPPPDEQAAIVRFLEHADRRIRKAIAAKQKLIKLLQEQKQVIIHQAVTRGLDPNVKLKPSGVEWLGDIPEGWSILKIGYIADVGNGSTPSRANLLYWTNGTFPWLNSGVVNQGRVTEANQFVTDQALRECHLPVVPPGSVLVAITGQGKTRGTAAVLDIQATINQHIAYITPRRQEGVKAEYLQAFLSAAYGELRRLSDDSGSTKGALTCSDLKNFKIAVPSEVEQARLLQHIDEAAKSADLAISRAQQEITLLREYRTRLIADVVTGKLDVRDGAARLPELRNEAVPAELDDPENAEDEELEAEDDT